MYSNYITFIILLNTFGKSVVINIIFIITLAFKNLLIKYLQYYTEFRLELFFENDNIYHWLKMYNNT